MILYFMRHAEAEDAGAGQSDANRRLTEKGIERTERSAAGLVALRVVPDLILASPLVRALQTAEIVGRVLEVEVREAPALARSASLEDIYDLCEEHGAPASLMLVGHEPDFSHLVGELTGGGKVEMKKGAIACLDTQAPARGKGTLCWLLTGKQLAAMR
jgi:phosphohistidine phosphatase